MQTIRCDTCGQDKPINDFNKKLSHSELRKRDCKECEKLKRTANRNSVTVEQVKMLKDCKCPLCENKATVIYDGGKLCRNCFNFVSYSNKFDNLLLAAINYKIMLRDFPFTRPYIFIPWSKNTDQMEFKFDG